MSPPPVALSDDFRRAMNREVLRTERLRVLTLIVTVVLLLCAAAAMFVFWPAQLDRMIRRHDDIWISFAIGIPFILFECGVLLLLRHDLALDRTIPPIRRYIGAFIETSLPTIGIAVQMHRIGPIEALGFTLPLTYFLFIILSTLRLDFRLSAFTGLVAALGLSGLALFHPDMPTGGNEPMLAPGYHIARSVVLLIAGVLAGAVGSQLRRQFEASYAAANARDHVTNLFGQHVSPQVVERLLAAGAGAASETRHVAVMFVDIRGFTAAAKSRTPHEVVARLDRSFAVLVDIVDRNGGIVNKFLGDGFLALFGTPFDDPQAANRALTAGREMLVATEADNAGSDWPLRIGIGLHLGDVVAGNVGSPRRKEYTVIGDTVNFASRIEALNKDHGSQLLISDALYRAVGADAADAVTLGAVAVRGYEDVVTIWRVA
jgi:adenylate cyclase